MSKSEIYTFFDEPTYIVKLEFISGLVFVHIRTKNNSIKAIKSIIKDKNRIEEIKDFLRKYGYKYMFVYTKNIKYAKKMGGTFLTKVKNYEVWKWDLTL